MSRTKLKKLIIADGQNDLNSLPKENLIAQTRKPQTFDELMGWDKKDTYITTSPEEYASSLKSKSLTDLQLEATAKNLLPVNDRNKLEKRLIREFEKYHQKFVPQTQIKTKFDSVNAPQEVIDICNNGK